MYTLDEAQKLREYYSDLLIGKSLLLKDGKDFLINSIRIIEQNDGYGVVGYCNYWGTNLYRDVNTIIEGTDIKQPKELLNQTA